MADFDSEQKAGQETFANESEPSKGEQMDVFGDEEQHDIRYKTLSWQASRCFVDICRDIVTER